MPSSTFLNLSPEKQEKLLAAAVREFTERPYNEASINRIIRMAHIPRGSFYMYFRDKEELFRYLLKESIDSMLLVLQEILNAKCGDVFAALPEMYDYLRTHCAGDCQLGSVGLLSVIVDRNCGLQKSVLLDLIDGESILRRLADSVNPDLLDLREEKDLEHILRMLLVLSAPIMYSGLRPGSDPDGREILESLLNILRRGMGKKPDPVQ